jgi:hypothetical protein
MARARARATPTAACGPPAPLHGRGGSAPTSARRHDGTGRGTGAGSGVALAPASACRQLSRRRRTVSRLPCAGTARAAVQPRRYGARPPRSAVPSARARPPAPTARARSPYGTSPTRASTATRDLVARRCLGASMARTQPRLWGLARRDLARGHVQTALMRVGAVASGAQPRRHSSGHSGAEASPGVPRARPEQPWAAAWWAVPSRGNHLQREDAASGHGRKHQSRKRNSKQRCLSNVRMHINFLCAFLSLDTHSILTDSHIKVQAHDRSNPSACQSSRSPTVQAHDRSKCMSTSLFPFLWFFSDLAIVLITC